MQNRTYRKNSRSLGKWLLSGLVVTSPNLAWAGDVRDTEASPLELNVDVEFTQAVKRFKDGDYVAALEGFMALRQRTDSPNVQLYIGYSCVQLGRPLEAYRAFSLSIEQTSVLRNPKYEATRNAAQAQLTALNQRLSRLTITLVKPSRDAVVKLDGAQLEPEQLNSPVTVEPGVHVVEAEAPGKETVTKSIALEKGSTKVIALLLQREAPSATRSSSPDTPTRSNSTFSNYAATAWTTAGVGLAGWGLFAAAGFRSKSVYEDLQRQCASGCSDAAHREQASTGSSWQTAANVGLAIGILGTVSAVTLFGIDWARGADRSAKTGLWLGPEGAQVSYAGRF
jgi:hypothetical protein